MRDKSCFQRVSGTLITSNLDASARHQAGPVDEEVSRRSLISHYRKAQGYP